MLEKKFTSLLKQAGITANGKNPWDMQIYSDRVYLSLVFGNLWLGETYMNKDWECEQLDDFFYRLLSSGIAKRKYISDILTFTKAILINAQKITRAYQIGQRHYDIGNNLFKAMLGEYMQYSCGYWKDGTDNLDQAQLQKLDLICKKINLQKGERVLDIGCGWGGFAKYAASKYGAKIVGLTVSEEQAKLAREFCKGENVEILLEDYRKLSGKFDKIVSIGMFEHVGPKNYRTYMQVVNKCLKDNGIFLLHTIVGLGNKTNIDPWIERYIFPNGVIPTMRQIMKAAEGILIAKDNHEFGPYYDKTLMAWWKNFNAAWPELKKDNRYDERFYRMWKYYLLSCAATFRSQTTQLWQIVFTKNGIKNYNPIR